MTRNAPNLPRYVTAHAARVVARVRALAVCAALLACLTAALAWAASANATTPSGGAVLVVLALWLAVVGLGAAVLACQSQRALAVALGMVQARPRY